MGQRSVVPDLIFQDLQEARAERVASGALRRGRLGDTAPSLDRATVFVTHRCNFRCRYCNGPHLNQTTPAAVRRDLLSRELGLPLFTRCLEQWRQRGLKHIHFTGGEPTLNPHLAEFIALTTAAGMLSSVTTNGSAPPDLYRTLARAGLSEVRLSLDSADSDRYDALVGVQGAHVRALQAIEALTAERDRHGRPFVILNACVDHWDADDVHQTVSWMLRLRPDDMKLLVIAENARELEEHASRRAVDDLLALTRALRPEGCDVLEKKIRSLFRHDVFGLRTPDAQHLVRHCFLPLTERTMDAAAVYPCSIYLRYHGDPLAEADAPFAAQQEAINHFVEQHDCRQDTICSRNCTTCSREFNVCANRRLEAFRAEDHGLSLPAIHVNTPPDHLTRAAMATAQAIARMPSQGEQPCLIVKPAGIHHVHDILPYIRQQGVDILDRVPVPCWQELSLYLYLKFLERKTFKDWQYRLAMNEAFGRMEGDGALLLRVPSGTPVAKLQRIRDDVRGWHPGLRRVMTYQGRKRVLKGKVVHVPDQSDLVWENRVLAWFGIGTQAHV